MAVQPHLPPSFAFLAASFSQHLPLRVPGIPISPPGLPAVRVEQQPCKVPIALSDLSNKSSATVSSQFFVN